MNIPQDMFWKVDPQAKTLNINIYHKPISSDSGDGKYEIQKKFLKGMSANFYRISIKIRVKTDQILYRNVE